MTETQVLHKETNSSTTSPQALNLAQLKTVQWVASNYIFQQGVKMATPCYQRAKGYRFLAWIIATIEVRFIT